MKKTNLFKRCIAIGACAFAGMIFSLSQVSNSSADDGWGDIGGNINWHFYEATGTLELTGAGDMADGAPWSSYGDSIKNVVIGEGITSIGKGACNNSHVSNVQMASTVTKLGDEAFYGSGITGIDLSRITSIGEKCFYRCESLTGSVVIPAAIKEVPEYLFYGCSSLTDITISEGITSLGAHAFSGTGIKNITIPSSVIKIKDGCFSDSKLVWIELPQTVQELGKLMFYNCDSMKYLIYNVPGEVPDVMCSYCGSLQAIQFGSGVTDISMNLWSSGSLQHIYVPSSVTKIEISDAKNLHIYSYVNTAAYALAGKEAAISFIDMGTQAGIDLWNQVWANIVNNANNELAAAANTELQSAPKSTTGSKAVSTTGRKTSASSTGSSKAGTTKTKKRISLIYIKTMKNKKTIKGKLSVKGAKVTIKIGKKTWKIKKSGKTFKIKYPRKLKNRTKVIIKAVKSGYYTYKSSYYIGG